MRELINSVFTMLRKALQSRKFWAAVAAAIPFAVNHQWVEFATVWMTYAGIEGVIDLRHSPNASKPVTAAPASSQEGME